MFAALPGWFATSLKAAVAAAGSYHTLNGLRHLGWDMGFRASFPSLPAARGWALSGRDLARRYWSAGQQTLMRIRRAQCSTSRPRTWPATPLSAPRSSRPPPSSPSERLRSGAASSISFPLATTNRFPVVSPSLSCPALLLAGVATVGVPAERGWRRHLYFFPPSVPVPEIPLAA